MLSLTPNAIKLLDWYEDGQDTRHFTFQLMQPEVMSSTQPGQFFMLHVPGVGEAPFTFTQLPDSQGQFRALVKNVGSVTSGLFGCERGARLGARGPFGRGWPIEKFQNKRVLIIAGGCGLAPLVSLTNALLDEGQCQQLALIYGAASTNTQMLNPERARWRDQMAVLNVIEHQDAQTNDLVGNPVDVVDQVLGELEQMPEVLLLCGPEKMMTRAAESLIERGLPSSSIWLSIERRMHCAVGLCGHCYVDHQYACKDGPTYRWDKLQALTRL